MSESIEVSEAKRRFPIQLPYNREFETRAREQDAFIAGWRAAITAHDAAKRAEWGAEQGETEWAVRWVETEGQPITDIGADEADVRALVIDQEGYAEAVVRTVSLWLPAPDTTGRP